MKDKDSQRLKDVKIPALLVAVVFFVYSRLAGAEIEPSILSNKFADSREVVEEFRREGVEIESLSDKDIKLHIRTVVAEQGTRMEWFQNIKVGAGLTRKEDHVDPAQDDEESTSDVAPRTKRAIFVPSTSVHDYLKPGLGTMMQPKFDYLSEEQQEDYAIWKAGIMRRIRAMQKADQCEMDTEEG